jgi:hypothetical protein
MSTLQAAACPRRESANANRAADLAYNQAVISGPERRTSSDRLTKIRFIEEPLGTSFDMQQVHRPGQPPPKGGAAVPMSKMVSAREVRRQALRLSAGSRWAGSSG